MERPVRAIKTTVLAKTGLKSRGKDTDLVGGIAVGLSKVQGGQKHL